MKIMVNCGKLLCLCCGVMAMGCSNNNVTPPPADLTQYVDPMIGSGGHGHVFVGANVPFGLVQAGPTEPTRGWDWCSGYHYSDSLLLGFGQMHLSGTGIGELGDISLLPVNSLDTHYVFFSHDDETVKPGYYSLKLGDTDILAEMTATPRVAMHRYTFPAANDTNFVVLNLDRGIGWDRTAACEMRQTQPDEIQGYRFSTGWAKDQRIYFCLQASCPFELVDGSNDTIAGLSFASNDEPLLLKVGLSPVSAANAKANIATELPLWDFDATVAQANDAWNASLGKIRIKSDDPEVMRKFYTALYHTAIAPSIFCDANGEYRGADGEIHQGNFKNYTTLSLWDAYRAAFPLYTLIHPEMQADFANTFINIYRQQGKLPVWHLMGCETDCMVGNPAIPIIADIASKGYDIDLQAAFDAAKASQMKPERGLDLIAEYGYIPFDASDKKESVSRGLEYAIADAGVAKLALLNGLDDDYRYFHNRSKAYHKYYDPATRFMRGVAKDGTFHEPFDPLEAKHENDDYTEGNAWQYLWLAPHDPYGLIEMLGGDDRFVEKLDSLFVLEGDMGEDASPDISGLIGQYAHGNEPSHHVVYLYNYAGKPWLAAEKLRKIMNEMYTTDFDGLCGNEDVGQMSAWFVLSAIGLYQVDPNGGPFIIGSPIVDEAIIDVGEGKKFEIVVHGNSPANIYVQRLKLNGEDYNFSYIDFPAIKAGGKLEFFMGDAPSDFGTLPIHRPQIAPQAINASSG